MPVPVIYLLSWYTVVFSANDLTEKTDAGQMLEISDSD